MTHHQAMHGEKRDVSDFRAFGCRAWVYLDNLQREKGKHSPRAKEAMYVGFTNNMNAWALWIPEDKKFMTSNQVKFSVQQVPFRKMKLR